ncbi:TonB-dependent receptor [Flavihumibacter petaseus]|uniref:Putative TonB-dependent receptor n=1 Tax=Flavihumibacter petaseus NBRC 106054 TaxID=1220578 RepID=A0A0E9MUT5_9BACT|nr:TonB-dependent receptor [Flavihumibacter petaseus]GAO41512.1 putative TonB-dependent receptor [Flavihumibacter petaseus NBRC 106054]
MSGNKHRFYLLAALLFVIAGFSPAAVAQPGNAAGRGIFSGKVVDTRTGQALSGASVYFPDIKKGAIADRQGLFTTPPINNGVYLVEVSYQGHAAIVENISINGNTRKDFSLQERIVENQAVTITGVSTAMRVKQSPQPVDILKREELQRISATNAIDALAHSVPGVSALSTGPAISKPFIRGLGYNRVITINDGIRQEGQQWGDEHGIEIDDYSIQRIEVLKGPASLLYGSDAMAGVINIITQKPANEGQISGSIGSEYQSNNGLRGFYGNMGGTKNGLSWNAYGSYKAAHDYQNKYDGYVFNSKFHQQNFGGMLGYGGSWGYTHVLVSYFDQQPGMVEGERDESGRFMKPVAGGDTVATSGDFKSIRSYVPYQHVQHFKVSTDNVFNLGKNNLDVTLGFQRNQRREYGNAEAATSPDAWFDLKTLTYAAKLQLPAKTNWKFTFGASGMYQTNDNRAEEVLIPDYAVTDIGIFGFTQYHLRRLSFSGGLRFDNRHINSNDMIVDQEEKFTAFTRDFANVSGSAGISYELNSRLQVKANLARGFRAPSLAELASNGAHEGTIRYEVGDKSLHSETSIQADAGLEWNTPHLSLEGNVFYNRINDFIFYRKLLNQAGSDSTIFDPESGNTLTVFQFNQQDAVLYGAELIVDIHPHPMDWLHIKNNFGYTIGRFDQAIDGSRNIPNIPAARLVSELTINVLPKGKLIRNLYLTGESDYTFRQSRAFTGFNTETVTGDYWLVNLALGADLHKGENKLATLQFALTNLGDVAYQNHLDRLKYTAVNPVTGRQGVFGMGRNFNVKLNIPLNFTWN